MSHYLICQDENCEQEACVDRCEFLATIKARDAELTHWTRECVSLKDQRDTALARIKELKAQVGEAVKVLTRIKCDCRYRPYTHQYVFKCDRCEVLARLSKPAESGERGMG